MSGAGKSANREVGLLEAAINQFDPLNSRLSSINGQVFNLLERVKGERAEADPPCAERIERCGIIGSVEDVREDYTERLVLLESLVQELKEAL